MMFHCIKVELRPKESDHAWIRGAVADAFLLVQKGSCLPIKMRAKSFKVGHEVYGTMRSVAYSALWQFVDKSERAWLAARFGRGEEKR
jgi:hypothetical protein